MRFQLDELLKDFHAAEKLIIGADGDEDEDVMLQYKRGIDHGTFVMKRANESDISQEELGEEINAMERKMEKLLSSPNPTKIVMIKCS
jgi:hypothetical protein